jgi:predicted component of type VI protein secretion system
MKRTVMAIIAAVGLAGGVAVAHGNAEHVRGTVTSITDTAITVQVSAKQTRTVTITTKTTVMKGDAHLRLKDVKVGDRVVLDVDKKTSVATEVKLATTAVASTAATPTANKRKE